MNESFHRLVCLVPRFVASCTIHKIRIVLARMLDCTADDLACNRQAHAICHIFKCTGRGFIEFRIVEMTPFFCRFLDCFSERLVDIRGEIVIECVDALATQQLFPAARLYLHLRRSKRRCFIFERRINSRPTLLACYQLTSDRLEPLCGWLAFDSLLTCSFMSVALDSPHRHFDAASPVSPAAICHFLQILASAGHPPI